MNNTLLGRAAAACAISAGLLGGGVLPAAQAAPSHSHNGYGWVKVCQYIHDYDDSYDYEGTYSIEDSYGHDWTFELGYDDYSCYKKKVRPGWTTVHVDDYPDHAEYDGHRDSYRFKVRKGYTYVVKYSYHSDDGGDHARAA